MKTPFGGGGKTLEDDEEDELKLKEGWEYSKLRVDIRALEEFERHLKLQRKIKEIYVPHGLDNVAIQRAFPDAEVTYLEEKTTEVEKHQRRGHLAIRGHAETHRGEKVDLVALFDTEVSATWQLLQNVGQHGYLICRAPQAAKILESQTNKFELKGVITLHGGHPAFIEDETKFGKIETDEDFEAADHVAGSVTREEMRDAVRKAFPGTEEGFVEKYKQLIRESREQNGELVAAHTPILKWKGEVKGVKIELKINTVLPPKKDDDSLWVFRKWNL